MWKEYFLFFFTALVIFIIITFLFFLALDLFFFDRLLFIHNLSEDLFSLTSSDEIKGLSFVKENLDNLEVSFWINIQKI